MADTNPNLPEGTDSVFTDAVDSTYSTSESAGTKARLDEAAAKVGDATAGLREQAADKARELAAQGKDRTVGALDNVVKLVDDAAGTIDSKVGEKYGDYARQASQAVAGVAETLRQKDVEDLLADARDLVRRSPAVAIGAAAAIGFVVARLIKSATPDDDRASTSARPVQAPTPSTATTVSSDFG